MIILDNLSMIYGNKLLYNDVSLSLYNNHRYGIVGANGVGKSTLFRLLTGKEESSGGEITINKRLTVGILSQDHFSYENERAVDVVIDGKKALAKALKDKEKLLSKEDFTDEDGYALGEIEEIIADNDGYEAESLAASLLVGLGVEEQYHFREMNQLSGGFKLRVLLAQSLFANPDILLLDEPSNHLDILSIEWLKNYLKNEYKGLLVVISHEHDFLNEVCTDIIDIDYGEINLYPGNYQNFLEKKQLVLEQKINERDYLQKKIEKMSEFVEKFRAGTRSRQAASREKQLLKIELPEIKNSSRRTPQFNFLQASSSGKNIIEVKNLEKSFEGKLLFKNVSFKVLKGEKIAILGKNGIGKSSMLKTMLGIYKSDHGEVELSPSVKLSYYAQNHHDVLKGDYSAADWLSDSLRLTDMYKVRSALGTMLLSGEEGDKKISVLSGGESARLLFAKIMLEQGNLLVLDEPTNHLDLESREKLAESLAAYQGTLMFVSHDSHFISKIAKRIIFIYDKGVIDFDGNYKDFVEKYSRLF
jgi:ATPase subunit of ABC transporter with duplicated ATPase domains